MDIIFADMSKDAAKIVTDIKKEIFALEKSVRFIDYDETGNFADNLNDMRLRIVTELYNKSPQIAFDIVLEFVDVHDTVFNYVYDDNGVVARNGAHGEAVDH